MMEWKEITLRQWKLRRRDLPCGTTYAGTTEDGYFNEYGRQGWSQFRRESRRDANWKLHHRYFCRTKTDKEE